jgi:hypothetical protein
VEGAGMPQTRLRLFGFLLFLALVAGCWHLVELGR